MRTGYFKGDQVIIGVRFNEQLREFYVFGKQLHLYDPILKVEITDEVLRLAFFVKHYLGGKYYTLEEALIIQCESNFGVHFVDVLIENREDN